MTVYSDDKQFLEEAKKFRQLWIETARYDSARFAELVMRDESGQRFKNAPHHERLHRELRRFKRLIVLWPPGFGKTLQLASFLMHALGRQTDESTRDEPPLWRCAVVGESFDSAAKTLSIIKNYIRTSADLQVVFPRCKPSSQPGGKWSGEAIDVWRPPEVRLRDHSLQAVGAGGSILGARLDLVVCDDILNFENTRTKESREAMYLWFKSTVVTRLDENSICIILTNAWHPDDLVHELQREGWPVLEEPAYHEVTGEPLWESQWPIQKVMDRIEELGPIEGPRKMLHKVRDEKVMRFPPEVVRVALERGRGLTLLDLCRPRDGFRTYTGVDLAVSRKDSAKVGRSVLFTILVHPSGVKQVVDVQFGRWGAREIITQCVEVHRRFDSIFLVENNAAQDYLRQFLSEETTVPVVPHTTGANKAHPEFGLEKMAVEIGSGKWIVPCDRSLRPPPGVREWTQDLYDYLPHKHTGDFLMASWFATEGARRWSHKVEYQPRHLTTR